MNPKQQWNPQLISWLQRVAGIGAAFLLLLLVLRGGEPPECPPATAPAAAVPPATENPPSTAESAAAPAIPRLPAVAKNRPPEVVSVRLEPELVYPGMPVRALVEASDAEGDALILTFRWQRNREDLPEQIGDTLDTSTLRKGDWITVAVTAADEHGRGEEKMARSVVVHNRPPEITSLPPASLDAGKFLYQMRAADPDGDELEYTLEEAPQGMKIDARSGLLEWIPGPDAAGRRQIRVIVSDGDAKAFQAFTIFVKNE